MLAFIGDWIRLKIGVRLPEIVWGYHPSIAVILEFTAFEAF